MDEQLSLLIALQDIDAKVRACVEEKKKLPELLSLLDQRREASKGEIEKAKEELLVAQKNRRDRDKDLEAGAQKIEKLKARTTDIKTNKEYTALLKEIEAAEQENKAIEDDILVLMEKIETASTAIPAAEARAREEETIIAADHKKHEESFAAVETDLKSLQQARQDIIAKIKPSALNRYEKLMRSKLGRAVVVTRGESCSGCYMSIPPQVYVNVKKNDTIISCPQCGRILYFKE